MVEGSSVFSKRDVILSVRGRQGTLIPAGTVFTVRGVGDGTTLFQDSYTNNYHLIPDGEINEILGIE